MAKPFLVDLLRLGPLQVMHGAVPPYNGGAGVAAPVGSFYLCQVGAAGTAYLKTGAADTAWTQFYADFLSVTDFGAVGDGVTDDRTAIQNCLNAAILAGLNVSFPPPSVSYKIGKYLDLYGARNLTIFGNADIRYPSDDTSVVPDGTANSIGKARSAFLSRYCRNVTWQDLTFVGGNSPDLSVNVGSGIYATKSVGLRMMNCTAKYGSSIFQQDATGDSTSTGDSIAVVGGVVTLTDSSALFTPGHEGAFVALTNCLNNQNTGVFLITAVISPTQIQYTNAAAVNEVHAFRWTIDDGDDHTHLDRCQSWMVRGNVRTGHNGTISNCYWEYPNTPDYTGIGDQLSLTGSTVTLTDNAGAFPWTIDGKYVVITGATSPANNGTFPITFISATQISFPNPAGVTETFNGNWWIPNGETVGLGAGVGSISVTGTTVTFTAGTPSFSAANVNTPIRFAQSLVANAGNTGYFLITNVLSSTQVQFENSLAVNENYSNVWTIDSYDRVTADVFGSSHAIYQFADHSGLVVEGCVFKYNRTACVKASGTSAPVRSILMKDCIAIECALAYDCGADDTNEHDNLICSGNSFVDCGTQRRGWGDNNVVHILGARNAQICNNTFYFTRNAIGVVDGSGTAGLRSIQAGRYVDGVSQPLETFTCTGNQFKCSPGSVQSQFIQTGVNAVDIGTMARWGTAGTPAGSGNLTKVGNTMTLSLPAALFSPADMTGQTIQLVFNANAGNNGSFTITGCTKTSVSWTNAAGVAGAFTGTYRVSQTRRGGACVISDNEFGHCFTIGVELTQNVAPDVHGNIFMGLVHDITSDGDMSPRFYGNRELGRNTQSGAIWVKNGVASWPVVYDNAISNQALGSVPAHSMDISIDGTNTVSYPLLGRTVRMLPTQGLEQVVIAYGSKLVDGDTFVLTDGGGAHTFTYKATITDATTQFNSFATLAALVVAIGGYTAVDYGSSFGITTNHLLIAKTVVTTADNTFTVAATALNPQALVVLRNNTAASLCSSRGSASTATTPDKFVAWSPLCRSAGGVMTWAETASAKTLLAAGSYPKGIITCIAKASFDPGNADYMTIGDGIRPAVLYGFDTTGGGVPAGRVDVNISGATTAASVAAILKAAILANQPAIALVDNANGTLSLTHNWPGPGGNVAMSENVADAGFTVSGLAGGIVGGYMNVSNPDDGGCCRLIQTAMTAGTEEIRALVN